jgi:D-tyrosyl-tRNA(Tyr) deacylase
MRLVVQRVEKAKVLRQVYTERGRSAQDKLWEAIGEIGKGLFVLVGVKKGDTEKDAESLAAKLSKLRVMADAQDKMNLTVADVGGSMLVVSQFTLHADTSGGNRPSFINSEEPGRAKELYEYFVKKLKENGLTVETGSFGDYMKIEIVLDGPVTILFSE